MTESKKKLFNSSSTLSMLVAYQPKTTYRVHGNVFGNAGGPCIIILTRGRNELYFRIIFKEKVIFCSLYFFSTVRCQRNQRVYFPVSTMTNRVEDY